MQGTWVWSLVREDSTCRGVAKPVCHYFWACALEPASCNYWACAPQLLKLFLAGREVTARRSLHTATEQPLLTTTRESLCSHKDSTQPKLNKLIATEKKRGTGVSAKKAKQKRRNVIRHPLYEDSKTKWNKWTHLQDRNRLTDLAHLWLPGEEWGEGVVRKFEIDMYTLLYLKWIINWPYYIAQGTLLNVMW